MTLCEHCGEGEATINVIKIINNKKTSELVCPSCVAQMTNYSLHDPEIETMPSMNLYDFLNVPSSIASTSPQSDYQKALEHFQKDAKFGHPNDYQLLRKEVEVLLRKLHGSTKHCGKVPQSHKAPELEIYELTTLMDEAASRERFEDAAKLRDRIRKLQQ